MNDIAKAIIAVGLCAIGLAGVRFNVEYSGWVLLVGLLAALS